MVRLLSLLMLFLLGLSAAQARVVGKEVSYTDGETSMRGFLAYDRDIEGKRPAVLVVHEWWGHNDYARKRALLLAGMGYTALAVDMYGSGRVADHPDDAGRFAEALARDLPTARKRFDAAMALLRRQASVRSDQIAAIGYCFGGGVVLRMAREGADLKGVASFHGSLATDNPAQAGTIRAKVAAFTGADDPMVPKSQVDAFAAEMDAAGVDYRLVSYPGVKHSFTNPDADEYARRFNLPLAYDAAADRDSWGQLGDFLADLFGPRD